MKRIAVFTAVVEMAAFAQARDLASYVNVFTGTSAIGHTFPGGAWVSFGMVGDCLCGSVGVTFGSDG